MERETKKIITPVDKHEVIIKSYVTGREKRELKNALLGNMEFEVKGNQATSSKMKAKDFMEAAENKVIETIIISIDGKTDGILNRVLDMKSKDTEFIIKEINAITGGNDFLV